MKKEEYYNRIKELIYKRFEALILIDLKNVLDLRNAETLGTQIVIFKKSGEVFYACGFSDKICKYFALKKIDFEILLEMWVQDNLNVKVNKVILITSIE